MHWLLGLPLVDRRRFPASASRPAACAAAALGAVLTITGDRAAAQTAPPPTAVPAPGTTALTYRLTGDWYDAPYSGELARIRVPVDVSAGPDGTVFVLESERPLELPTGYNLNRQVTRIHAIAADDGAVRRVIDLGRWLRGAEHLDAGWDGTVAVVGVSSNAANGEDRLVLLGADGEKRAAWDLPAGEAKDVAALPDGRIVLAVDGDIVLIDPAGGATRRVALADLGLDDPGSGFEYYITALDAARDGRITSLVYANRDCPLPTSRPYTPGTPAATATPRPSLAVRARPHRTGETPSGAAQSEAPCSKFVAVTLSPALTLESARPSLGYSDIAVRDGVVFGAIGGRSDEALSVRPIDAEEPHVAYLAPLLPDGGRARESLMGARIAVAPDGGIVALWRGGSAFAHGPVRLGVPGMAAAPPTGLAYDDIPTITGPVRPRAVTAGADRPFVLGGGSPWSALSSSARHSDPQGLYNGAQTWTFDGRLVGQWAQAGQGNWSMGPLNNFGGAPEDVAAVGARLYSATPGGIWMRTGSTEANWVSGVPGVRFIALDADDTAVAAFDAVGSRVVLFDTDGAWTGDWPVAAQGRAVAASDLAVGGGRVYIADTGRNRVLVRSVAGDDLGEWRTHDGPQRIDRTDDGDIVVLGRGGWGLRYSPDGALRAAWRMPGAFGAKRAQGTDITAGPDGAVYVTYSRVTIGSAEDRSQDGIEAAGIWRFEMSVPPPDAAPPSPDARHCLVDVGKVASPTRVPLGAPVTIALTVQGECPKEALPAQLLFVVDTSWSMNDGFRYRDTPPGALERARRVLVPLLGALDPSVVDVGLVTFGDGAALQTVLSDDIADLRSRILRAQADGDTRMGAGVDLAHAELNGPRRAAGARRAIVIVSDGVFKDDPRAAVAAARADGIDVHALIVTTPEFTPGVRASLEAMLGPDRLDIDPSPDRATAIIDAIGAWRTEPNVFEALTVRDVVPANMRYVLGSAVPAAAWDASTRTLTWTLPPRPAGARVTLTYAVVPEAAGTWPTNVEADATWRDVRGGGGQLRFPVPRVDVVDRRRIFLPYAMRAVCASWTRPIDLVLVQDVSSSMSERAADGRRTKLEVAVEAAAAFLDRLNTFRDRVAVVAFDADAHVVAPLSNDFAAARSGLASLRPGRGTRIDRGLASSVAVLSDDLRALALPVVVLLSDGLQNGSADPVRAVLPELRAIGSRVFVIGYGQAVDEALLREIASDPADYRYAPAVEDLRAVYEGVGRTLLCP